mgnify:CR=1 FL=1
MKQQLALASLTLISFLPFRLARLFGRLLGAVMVLLATRSYRVAKLNIALCFPTLADQEVADLAGKRMAHLGQSLFETPGLWRRPSSWLESKILGIESEHLLRDALHSDSGTILLVPHQGNWEVIGLWLAKQTPMTALYQPPKMPKLGDWIKRARENTGANLVPTSPRGVAAILKALQRGETTAILPDQQPPANSGDFAPIFDVPALTVTLPYNLLKRSPSRVIFAAAVREQNGWRLHFCDAPQDIYNQDAAISLKAMNRGVESIVALAPDQYQWEYKRFRSRPHGNQPIYPRGM